MIITGLKIFFIASIISCFFNIPLFCQAQENREEIDRKIKLELGVSLLSHIPINANELHIAQGFNSGLKLGLTSCVSRNLEIQVAAKFDFNQIRISTLVNDLLIENGISQKKSFFGVKGIYSVKNRVALNLGAHVISTPNVFNFFDIYDNRSGELQLVKTVYVQGKKSIIPYISTGLRFLFVENDYFSGYMDIEYYYNLFRNPILVFQSRDYLEEHEHSVTDFGNHLSLSLGINF